MAAAYSMDLRERVFKAWKASGDADDVAATFGVSRAWVHRLAQRHRETQSLAPRRQTKFRARVLADQEARLKALVAAHPRCDVGRAPRAVAHDRGAQHAVVGVRSPRVDRQKKRYTPPNSVALTSRPRAGSGRATQPLHDAGRYVFVDESGVTTDLLRRYARSPRGTRVARSHAV